MRSISLVNIEVNINCGSADLLKPVLLRSASRISSDVPNWLEFEFRNLNSKSTDLMKLISIVLCRLGIFLYPIDFCGHYVSFVYHLYS